MKTFDEAIAALNTDEGAERYCHFNMLDFETLRAIAAGDIDAGALARACCANRGVNVFGKWVGFEAAKKIWKDSPDGKK